MPLSPAGGSTNPECLVGLPVVPSAAARPHHQGHHPDALVRQRLVRELGRERLAEKPPGRSVIVDVGDDSAALVPTKKSARCSVCSRRHRRRLPGPGRRARLANAQRRWCVAEEQRRRDRRARRRRNGTRRRTAGGSERSGGPEGRAAAAPGRMRCGGSSSRRAAAGARAGGRGPRSSGLISIADRICRQRAPRGRRRSPPRAGARRAQEDDIDRGGS